MKKHGGCKKKTSASSASSVTNTPIPRKKPFIATQDPNLFKGYDLPLLRGQGQDSVFIETTHIQDKEKLKGYLNSFNTEENIVYYGRQPEERKHESRTFLETSWDTQSNTYQQLITNGLRMNAKTLLKGFKSLPTDLRIVRVRIEQLPLIHPKLLLEQLKQRLAFFGEVLQLGLLKEGQCFVGKGYAYLNLDTDPEPDEALRSIVNWIDDRRRIVLTWDHVPPYCYICKKEHHIRTECPVYMNTKVCFKCGQNGHIIKKCPYRNLPFPPKKARKDKVEEEEEEEEEESDNFVPDGTVTPNSEASSVSYNPLNIKAQDIDRLVESLKTIAVPDAEKIRMAESEHLKTLIYSLSELKKDDEKDII